MSLSGPQDYHVAFFFLQRALAKASPKLNRDSAARQEIDKDIVRGKLVMWERAASEVPDCRELIVLGCSSCSSFTQRRLVQPTTLRASAPLRFQQRQLARLVC